MSESQREFFQLNGRYLVDSENTSDDMATDAACLLGCAETVVQTMIDGMADEGSQLRANPKDVVSLLFTVLYQLQMAQKLNLAR